MSLLCILGGSGFVGRRVLRRALREGRRVRALEHRSPVEAGGAEVVRGDAGDASALDRLLEPNAVALNFAYGGDDNSAPLAQALASACRRRGVRRLVHVSTCSVYGRTPGALIDEETPCAPAQPYERAKLAAEQLVERAGCEVVILRPTAVFGPGGRNLETLALRVLRRGWVRRYARASVMGRRRMHAVDVECVAAAALFLVSAPLERPAERFIVSQDEEPLNDYASLEAFFVTRLGAESYPVPLVTIPMALRLGLRLAGRSNTEPMRRYSAAKLAARGFSAPRTFVAALEEYAAWIAERARP